MSKDAIIGALITFLALGFMTYIVLWSRRIIERIYRKKLGSAREILKDLNERK
jgi:hypothetical protein